MLNALKWTEELQKAGFTEEQARANIGMLAQMTGETLATKEDLKDFRREMQHQLEILRAEIRELELRMTIRLGGMMVLAIGTCATLVKLL